MASSLALLIGLRYTKAKRRNHFISFISFSSLIGIALGVMVLITVLSVMNGFDHEIKDRVFSMARQVTVSTFDQKVPNWQQLRTKLLDQPDVKAIAPFVSMQGLLTVGSGAPQPVMAVGIDTKLENSVSVLNKKITQGSLNGLQPSKFGIVLGKDLADNLGVGIGNKVTLMIPKVTTSFIGAMPRFKRFTVVAIFDAGNGFGYNTTFAYLNMHDAQLLAQLGSNVSGLQLKLNNLYLAPAVTRQITNLLQGNYFVSNWTQDFGNFFHAVAMEKTMMFLILLLLVAIAAFNLVASLVMAVNDKVSDIAILRTIGASPMTIMKIFVIQGGIIGLFGIIIGLIAGLILATHVTELVNWLQSTFHLHLFESNVYYVNELPSQVQFMDVFKICVIAFIMSLLATIYPAWRASKVQPAEALRYE